MEQMDCKPYQSLSKAPKEMELAYTSSSDESEDGRNLCKSYASRETLPDYGQEMRLNYNSHRAKRKTADKPAGGTVQNHQSMPPRQHYKKRNMW